MPAGHVLQYVLFQKYVKTLKKAAVYSHFEIPKPFRLAYLYERQFGQQMENITSWVLCCNMSVQKVKVFGLLSAVVHYMNLP